MKKILYYSFFLIVLAATACEDGAPGPAGPDGVNGINGQDGEDGQPGQDGQDGQDGQNAAGYDEMVQFGNITIYLEGATQEGHTFRDTSDYKFAPMGRLAQYNTIEVSDEANVINVYRFISSPDDVFQGELVNVQANFTAGDPVTVNSFTIYIQKNIVTAENEVFRFSNGFSSGSYIDLTVSDYTYDSTTGSLTFVFSFSVPGQSNQTTNDLQVSGEVDVIVLERIN